MTTLNITNSKIYKGCGRAWAAINSNNEVVELKYMDNSKLQIKLPKWVEIVGKTVSLSSRYQHGAYNLAQVNKDLEDANLTKVGKRGGKIKPSIIVNNARDIYQEAGKLAFLKYRTEAKNELSKLGKVVSGMCSCHEFIC